MIQINMLPWRERAREIKKKNFFIAMAGSVGLALFVILLFHIYYDDLLAYQDQRNAFLQTEIAKRQEEVNALRKEREQQGVIQVKLQFLMGLREKSYDTIQLLNEVLKIVPDSITLSKLSRDGYTITIEGKAQSELAITAFLKGISENTYFAQPVLTGINMPQSNNAADERYFQIKVDEREEALKAQAALIEKEKAEAEKKKQAGTP